MALEPDNQETVERLPKPSPNLSNRMSRWLVPLLVILGIAASMAWMLFDYARSSVHVANRTDEPVQATILVRSRPQITLNVDLLPNRRVRLPLGRHGECDGILTATFPDGRRLLGEWGYIDTSIRHLFAEVYPDHVVCRPPE